MSTTHSVAFACPSCGKEITLETHPAINRQTTPELAEQLFEGTLFMQPCPECGATIPAFYPTVYSDMENHAIVHLVGDRKALDEAVEEIDTCKEAGAEMGPLAEAVESIRYRIVLDPFDLQEKAYVFAAGLDDRAVEFVKSALYVHLAESLKDGEGRIAFSYKDDEGLHFEAFDGEKVGTVSMPMDIYDEMAALLDKAPVPADYIVDQNWAVKQFM